MNILFKSTLLSQCLVLGLSNAFAVKPIEEQLDKVVSQITRPTVRISLTMPHQQTRQDQSCTDFFHVTMKGSISGETFFNISYRNNKTSVLARPPHNEDVAASGERRIFCLIGKYWRPLYFCTPENPNDQVTKIDKHLLFSHFDLSSFQGDITISIKHSESSGSFDGSKFQVFSKPEIKSDSEKRVAIPVHYIGPRPFNSDTRSVWIMLNNDFNIASLKAMRGQGVRSLRNLALARVRRNIVNHPDDAQYSQASLQKSLPPEVFEMIPTETWAQPEEKSKTQPPSSEPA